MRFIKIYCCFLLLASLLVLSCKDGDQQNEAIPSELLSQSNFTYLGAFRVPDGPSEIKSFNYGGHSMTYFPDGDSQGTNDGFPGSLFITGHAWEHQLAEISIPTPVNSAAKNLQELNRALLLQDFTNIISVENLEIPRTGLAFLRKQGNQMTDKIHFCWGFHMQDGPADLTHGWCQTNLSDPGTAKGWYLQGHPYYIQNMSTNDYMFEIPQSWAAVYSPGMRLASGRFRDGGWSGQGPALFAIGPWNHGNPPPYGSGIENIPLLLYTSTMDQEGGEVLDGYHHSDEWSGAVWLTAGNRAAVIFIGTKGFGNCWYGNQEGPCLECDDRGWWSNEFRGLILFYDPADLAQSAQGLISPGKPQPYTSMEIDGYFYSLNSIQQKHHTGACTFDRTNGLLYILEYQGDGDKCLVHVFRVSE